jgi:hypothetical protein
MKNAKTLSARVFYICDLRLFEECDKIPNIRGRVSRNDLYRILCLELKPSSLSHMWT